jgi:hypothetical protein
VSHKVIWAISNLNYENGLRKLELITLKDRRLRGDLIQMFKIMNKMAKFDRYNRFQIIDYQVRGHYFKLQENYSEKISFTLELLMFEIDCPVKLWMLHQLTALKQTSTTG